MCGASWKRHVDKTICMKKKTELLESLLIFVKLKQCLIEQTSFQRIKQTIFQRKENVGHSSG